MLHRHADFTSGAHQPEPDEPVRRQLGVNCVGKGLSTFASQRLCLTALAMEWSVEVSKRYTVPT